MFFYHLLPCFCIIFGWSAAPLSLCIFFLDIIIIEYSVSFFQSKDNAMSLKKNPDEMDFEPYSDSKPNDHLMTCFTCSFRVQ